MAGKSGRARERASARRGHRSKRGEQAGRGGGAHALKGQMAATTPSGSRYVLVSMSLATSRISPLSSSGAPQAASATCRPRSTSPLASAKVLPCSWVMLAARRSQLSRIRATKRNMICWRASTLVARQAGKAFWADSTAARSSGVGRLRHARHQVVGGRVVQVDELGWRPTRRTCCR